MKKNRKDEQVVFLPEEARSERPSLFVMSS
jgi:hypothetical protein